MFPTRLHVHGVNYGVIAVYIYRTRSTSSFSPLLSPVFHFVAMDTDNYEQETDGEEGRVSSTLPNRPRRALTIPLTDKDTEVIRVTFERDKPKEPDQSGFIRTLWQRKQSQKKAWIKAPVVHRVPQETYNQKQSPLFQLPFDIRLMIWKEGLAGCRWHIGLSDLKLKGCECNGRHTRTEIISYERRRDMDGVSIPSVLEPADRIPVLLTCRMMQVPFVGYRFILVNQMQILRNCTCAVSGQHLRLL